MCTHMYLNTLFALCCHFGQILMDTLCLHNNTSNMAWPTSRLSSALCTRLHETGCAKRPMAFISRRRLATMLSPPSVII